MPIDSIILAGGQSRRMGRPKALLEINQVPLITHIIQQLSVESHTLFIAASMNDTAIKKVVIDTPNIQFIDDYYPTNEGPLSGIATALTISSADYLWVTTVDSFGALTGIRHAMLTALETNHADIVYLQDDRHDYPLQAIIKTSLKHSLTAYLATGKRSVLRWYASVNHLAIKLPHIHNFWPNINTPEDFDQLIQDLDPNNTPR